MWRAHLEEISSSSRLARVLWFLTLGLLVVLFACLHLPGVSQGELILDDAGTWGVAMRPWLTVFTLPTEFHSQPPLYYLALHFLCKIGDAPWLVRGFSFLCGLGTFAYVLLRAKPLSLLARVAFALLFMLGDLGDYVSTAVRPYGMAALLMTISCILFIRLMTEPLDKRLTLAYAVATLAALYTNAFVVVILPIQLAWLIGVYLWRTGTVGYRRAFEQFRGRLLAGVAIGVGYLPYLLLALHYQSEKYTGLRAPQRDRGPLRLSLYWSVFHEFFLFSKAYLWMLAGLMVLGLTIRLARKKWDGVLWLSLGVAQIAFVWSFVNGHSLLWFQPKYMLSAYLAICFLVALAFAHLPRLVSRGIWLLLPLALGYLVQERYGKCAEFFARPRPLGHFQLLHKTMLDVPGRKVIFFDVGYDGQHLEYQARNTPEIEVATMRGTGWASGGDNHLDPAYIERIIAEHAADTPCFYYVIASPRSPYATTFEPRMRQLGFTPGRTLWVAGQRTPEFCRPKTN